MVPRPELSLAEAAAIAREWFGVEGSATALPGERDRNFRIDAAGAARFVLKVSAPGEDRDVLGLQARMLAHLGRRDPSLPVPALVPALSGDHLAEVALRGRPHPVRLLRWLDGVLLASYRPRSEALDRALGNVLGRLSVALEDFDEEVSQPHLPWSLDEGIALRADQDVFPDPARRALWVATLGRWCAGLDAIPTLPRRLLHHDANDHNVLVAAGPGPVRIAGLLDFGDAMQGARVAEAAVASAYAMLDRPDPVAVAAALAAGFHGVQPLEEREVEALVPLAVLRLCQSARNAAVQRRAEPDNEYLSISEAPVWRLLERLQTIAPRWATFRVRRACGLPGSPRLPSLGDWLDRTCFAPVLERDPAQAPRTVLDLGVASAWLAERDDPGDMAVLAREIEGERTRQGAWVALGGYGEPRLLYTSEAFTTGDADPGDAEARTVHLGVDLWVAAGTRVQAPWPGKVRSLQDNAAPLDYGPTVILQHEGPDGTPFFTLYGHLSRQGLGRLSVGQMVAGGERIGAVGDMHENGGWPPHLHFQVITDLLEREGDFPGVAAPGEAAAWLELCPDPNLLLGVPELAAQADPPGPRAPVEELQRRRRRHLGPNLSLSYRAPLHLVKGRGQFLWDAWGRRYLDAVNNVPQVGHCHPRVTQAARRQMALLNTNTRYLSDLRLRYVERLCALLPEPLSVCYLVSSGSEANELALRLAWAHTGRRDLLVQEAGYHGNTATLVDASPYKHGGPGGAGAPERVHVVPLPDPYRGRHRGPCSGQAYVAEVRRVLEDLQARRRAPAAFLVEPLPGCGGQVVPPEGYLAGAFAAVRAAGGLCIADEVQSGFGRVGPDLWAFARQGAVPDLVTLGKPIGNGHPMGAVVTTPEVAASFVTGMEYFSTFGGNPVSCAIGLAVLDVLRDEALPAHAEAVGEELRRGLRELAARHPLVGDVRGVGLFLGVELVRDREARTPAPDHARHVVERMKERGILLSTDGPDANVLKIKPPLVFTREDAARLVRTLDEVLAETALGLPH